MKYTIFRCFLLHTCARAVLRVAHPPFCGQCSTIQAVLTALFQEKPFETLPGGALLGPCTDSMIAGDACFKGPRERALGRLLSWVQNQDRRPVILKRTMRRVGPGRDQKSLYTIFFGTASSAPLRYLLRVVLSLSTGLKAYCGRPENGYFSQNVHELSLNLIRGFTLNGEFYMPDARLGPVVVMRGGQASFLRL